MYARALAAVLVASLALAPLVARADEPTGLALSENCRILSTQDVSKVIGVDVQASDPATQSGGICTFPSQSATQEGVASYSIVTRADVVARASYFRLLSIRRCGNIDPHAPNAAQCATFRKLAIASTIAQYYAGRSGGADALVRRGLGDAAVATATAVYVLRGGEVFECVARVGEFLDVDRSVALASLLLARVEPIDAPPLPAASNTP